LKDDLRRGDSDLAILKDQQGKSQLSVQQLANDNSRLQGDTKQFDATIKFMAQQRDGLATEIDGRQTQLRQLKQEAAGQQSDTERWRKQSEDHRGPRWRGQAGIGAADCPQIHGTSSAWPHAASAGAGVNWPRYASSGVRQPSA